MNSFPLQIVGNFIFAKDDSDGKFYVIPQEVYPGFKIMLSYGKFYLTGDNTPGTLSLTINSVLSKAKECTKFAPTYIIRRGQFVDIKKTLEAAGIYIEDDELIPSAIMKRFSYSEDKMDYLIDGRRVDGYFDHDIPAEKRIAPAKEYFVYRGYGDGSYNIHVNGKKYYESDIIRKLQDKNLINGGSLIVDGNVIRSGKNEKVFTGGFIDKLMSGEQTVDEFTEEVMKRHFGPEKTDVKSEPKNPEKTIVAYSRSGDKTFAIYSDFSMKFDSNDDAPELVLTSVCENIIMYLTKEHIIVNCSGKFRTIKYSEILNNISNYDGSVSLVLGSDEKITEVIRIRHAYMDLERGKIINDAIRDRSYPMIRN